MYIMYNTVGAYLYDNGNSVGAGKSYGTDQAPNPNYIWRFTKTTGNNYTIESMGHTGYYMQSSKVDNSRVPLTTNRGNNDYFTVSNSNTGNRIYFQSTASTGGWWSSYYFLSLSQDGKTVCGNTNSRRDFYLYEVTMSSNAVSISKEISVPIDLIDKKTGKTSPLTSICRNDFIEMLVNVTYNEKTGTIDFEVTDWDKVSGDVTFD